jgi:hypothetical protein
MSKGRVQARIETAINQIAALRRPPTQPEARNGWREGRHETAKPTERRGSCSVYVLDVCERHVNAEKHKRRTYFQKTALSKAAALTAETQKAPELTKGVWRIADISGLRPATPQSMGSK